MGIFVWKEGFKVGVAEIDRQHELFLERINDCTRYAPGCGNTAILRDMINRLKEYAVMHFTYEEELMRSGGYPEYARHVEQHRYFDSQVKELDAEMGSGGQGKVESVFIFMRDWLVNHILEEDKKYAPFVKGDRAV